MANFKSETIWTGDNLEIMRGLNSGSVDLIYLDPPFNSNTNYAAPIGAKAADAEFKDTWILSDIDIEWINLIQDRHPALHNVLLAASTDSDKSYLAYMAVRILEMRRILKDTGSIYLHCDPVMSHYLKLVMDTVFGRKNFLNEIIWAYRTGGVSDRWFGRKHDVILFYAAEIGRHVFHVRKERSYSTSTPPGFSGVEIFHDEHGRPYTMASTRDVWKINALGRSSGERTGYPTQKPLKLLNRIIDASSNEGDMVLDPFCGCATTCVAAQDLNRKWLGIDISARAAELVNRRINDEQGPIVEITNRIDIPMRTDLGKLPSCRSHKRALYGEQGGNCAGCQEHFKINHFHIDHIIAKSKGGTDHVENLQLLCGSCNSTKGNRGMDYLRAKLNFST